MSEREKFFKNFNSISSSFAEYISVYYALDLNNLLGFSYFELNRVSSELSGYFLKVFGEHSQFVGVSLSDYFLLPCIILGIWKSGNCFSGVGTQYTRKNNLQFLNFLKVKFLITDSNKSEYEGELVSYFFIHRWKFFVWVRQTEKLEEMYFKDICFGIMTSGSTGEPKIIQVPWSCIIPNAVELSSKFQVMQQDIIFLASPYSFDPFFIEFFMAVHNGCSLMIVSNAIKLSPSDLLKILFDSSEKCDSDFSCIDYENLKNENYIHIKLQKISKKNISILQMTPSVFKRWTNAEIQNTILSSNSQLRILILGGEKFPKEILKLRHPKNTTRIFNIYGITEISCWAFLNELTTTNISHDFETSIGKPLQDIVYKISTNEEFEIGSNKRVCLINKEKTFQVDHSIFRRTGDIVKLFNNEIHYVGRSNQIVKKYGVKINLAKIEDYFLEENKLIKECVCIFDEENLKLVLFYVPIEAEAEAEEINYKLLKVEEFQKKNYLIPVNSIKTVEIPDYLIEITKIPVNQHGKCDKQKLLQYLKGIDKSEKVRPNLETIFKRVWVEVLGIKKVNSLSFTESGGDSVLGLALLNKLEDESVRVPQNFIVDLLSGKSYDDCLRCLSLAQDKSGIPKKKIKINAEAKDFEIFPMWKFDLGKCVDATPVIFIFEGEERLVIGSHSSKLSCINPNSGCEIWTAFLGDRIESGFRPTKDGSRGFIGCYDHCIYCIATSDGSIIWKFQTGDVVKSTPCLSDNQQIVYVASYDGHLYCLSTTDGQVKESLKLTNGGIFCSGIISESLNCFFLATLDGTCVAINQETNRPVWKTSLASPVFASPCLTSKKREILFAEVLGYVHCLDALNGEKMWTFKAEGNVYSSPTVGVFNGINHIIFGCHDAHLYCLRYEKEPELKWKQQLDSSVFAKPLIVAEFSSICAPTTKGFVYFCDFDGGSVKARLKLDGEVFSSPVYCNNRLFVGCRDNYVYSLRISEMGEN